MPPPAAPKIYHIMHVDRLPSIIADRHLWSDAEISRRSGLGGDTGTTIGMNSIKEMRLTVRQLNSHPGLYVGQCVPFYFCPRSVMLYLVLAWQTTRKSLESTEAEQEPIVHLAKPIFARQSYSLRLSSQPIDPFRGLYVVERCESLLREKFERT